MTIEARSEQRPYRQIAQEQGRLLLERSGISAALGSQHQSLAEIFPDASLSDPHLNDDGTVGQQLTWNRSSMRISVPDEVTDATTQYDRISYDSVEVTAQPLTHEVIISGRDRVAVMPQGDIFVQEEASVALQAAVESPQRASYSRLVDVYA